MQHVFHTGLLTLLALIFCAALPVSAGEFPEDWYWERPEEHVKFEGIEAPALTVGPWIAGDFDLEKMRGQIVVVDFWATWCGPCLAAMPHNTALAEKYAKDGVALIGVCTDGDAQQMADLVEKHGAKYPNALAHGTQVETDWPIQWYPTYAVIDREGVVRAFGAKPEKVEAVVETLLAEQAEANGQVRVRPAWLEGDAERRARLAELEAVADQPPALMVENWHNSEPLALDELQGKVVVLDFWATWSGPSEKAIPKHNALMQQYGEEGLVIIGVCSTLGGEAIAQAVEANGIAYPVCVDIDNQTNKAYTPNGYPDYYIFDRAGKLRVADCANNQLEAAVKALLSEEMPEEVSEEHTEASAE